MGLLAGKSARLTLLRIWNLFVQNTALKTREVDNRIGEEVQTTNSLIYKPEEHNMNIFETCNNESCNCGSACKCGDNCSCK